MPSRKTPKAGDRRLTVVYLPLAKITPYARNPRKNEASIAKAKGSIAEFGFKQPIVVDRKYVIIAGHTRFQAAQSLGLTEVPVVVATDLTPTQVKAYRLADNRVGQDSQWDAELLGLELQDLNAEGFDFPLLGFDEAELERLLPAELEPIDAGDGESSTGSERSYLTFADERIPLASDELATLSTRLKAYIEERGSAIGFARSLCTASRDA